MIQTQEGLNEWIKNFTGLRFNTLSNFDDLRELIRFLKRDHVTRYKTKSRDTKDSFNSLPSNAVLFTKKVGKRDSNSNQQIRIVRTNSRRNYQSRNI